MVTKKKTEKPKEQTAYEQIAEKLEKAANLIKECEAMADEHQVVFSFGVAYGMGGTRYPKRPEGAEDEGGEWRPTEDGWVSSSSQC